MFHGRCAAPAATILAARSALLTSLGLVSVSAVTSTAVTCNNVI